MNPIDLLVFNAMQYIGVPYRWGGESPMGGLDCSGFVQLILSGGGVDPVGDQSAQALYDALVAGGGGVGVYGPGSVAFFGKSDKAITHVGFCISEFQMVEAAGGDSKVNTVQDAIDRRAFVRLTMIDRRKDLVAVVMPNYKFER